MHLCFYFCMENFQISRLISSYVYRYLKNRKKKDSQTYIEWLVRLIIFCFWMAYFVVRWPIDLVFLRES